MSNGKVYIVTYNTKTWPSLSEAQGTGIGGAEHESCGRSCTPQVDGGSKKRESQAASDPADHVCILQSHLDCSSLLQ